MSAGRPPKYEEWLKDEKLILLQGWARDGLSDEQISHNMGIAYSTFREWKKKFKAFSAALKKGKEVADYEVENATFKNACGHIVEECVYERMFNKKSGEYEMICTKKTTRYIPPNPTSQIYWLKHRKPNKWGENQNTDTTALDRLDAILGKTKDEAFSETE